MEKKNVNVYVIVVVNVSNILKQIIKKVMKNIAFVIKSKGIINGLVNIYQVKFKKR